MRAIPSGEDQPHGGAGGEMHEPGQDADWFRGRKLATETQDDRGARAHGKPREHNCGKEDQPSVVHPLRTRDERPSDIE